MSVLCWLPTPPSATLSVPCWLPPLSSIPLNVNIWNLKFDGLAYWHNGRHNVWGMRGGLAGGYLKSLSILQQKSLSIVQHKSLFKKL
jgi:hypothetical protein